MLLTRSKIYKQRKDTLVSRYDAEGLRAEIEENEKLTKFIFHKDNILVEADKDFNVISRFTRGHEVVAADIAEVNVGLEFNLNRYYYTTDEQGSTAVITDKNQQVKNEYYYDAFGCVLENTEQIHNRITYTGQQFDGMTGQYYLRGRFYNPVIGRFTQEDIYRGDGLNLYAYCGNNPVSYYDPSGYNKELCGSKSRSAAEVGKAELDLIKQYPNNKVFGKSVIFNAGEGGTGITYKVLQRNDIDWDMVRTTGAKKGRNLTNAQAAELHGLAPILDSDGHVATLHHSQQHSVGPLFEASTRYHNISNAKKEPLHPYKGKLNPFNPMSEETIKAFQKVDSIEYWKTRGRDARKGVK